MRWLYVALLLSSQVQAECSATVMDLVRQQLQPQIEYWLSGTDTQARLIDLDGGCGWFQQGQVVQLKEPRPVQWFEKSRLLLSMGDKRLWVVAQLELQQRQFFYRCDIAEHDRFDAECIDERLNSVRHISPAQMQWQKLQEAKSRRALGQGNPASPLDWLTEGMYGKGQFVDVVLIENNIVLQLKGKLVADSKMGQQAKVLVEGPSRLLQGKLEDDGKVYLDR